MVDYAEPLHDFYVQHPDTAGLFGSIAHAVSKAAKSVGKATASAAKIVAMPITAPIKATTKLTSKIPILGSIVGAVNQVALMPIAVTQGILEGGRIDRVALGNLKNTLASVKTLGPYIQTVISLVPGVGTGVSAAMGAGLALAEGKSITDAMVAGVRGAIPGGPVAQSAFSVGQAAIEGKPINQIAIAALPISNQQKQLLTQGLNAVKQIASGKNVAQSVVDNAIKSLPPTYAKAVQIGMAMGHAKSLQSALKTGAAGAAGEALKKLLPAATSAVSKGVPSMSFLNSKFLRPGIPNIAVKRLASPLSAVPYNVKNISDAIRRNPALATTSPMVLAQRFNTNVANAMAAVQEANKMRMLPWRSLSPQVVAMIRRYVPHVSLLSLRLPHTDISGLDSSGQKYIVEKGDGPWKISQKLTGNGNRWKELLDYNKDKSPKVDKNVWVGEILNLPPSWQKPTVAVLPPTKALPSTPTSTPVVAPVLVSAPNTTVNDTVPSILQAKALLAAWGKSDGLGQSGFTDYGTNPLDLTAAIGPRDTLMLKSFQNWDNKTLGNGLNQNGVLDAATLQALQTWAAERAGALTNSATPVVSGGATPEIIIAAPVGGNAPTVTVSPSTTPVNPTPSVQPKQAGSAMGPMAVGAIAGGLVGGLPGAIIGAIGGAAIG